MPQTILSQLENIYQLHILEGAYTQAIDMMKNHRIDLAKNINASCESYQKQINHIDITHIPKPIKPDIPEKPQLILEPLIDTSQAPKKVAKPNYLLSMISCSGIFWTVLCFVALFLIGVLLLCLFSVITGTLPITLFFQEFCYIIYCVFQFIHIPLIICAAAAILIGGLIWIFNGFSFDGYIDLDPTPFFSADMHYKQWTEEYKKYQEYLSAIQKNNEISAENARRKVEYERQLTLYNNVYKPEYDRRLQEYQTKMLEYDQNVADYTAKKNKELHNIINNNMNKKIDVCISIIQAWTNKLTSIRQRLHTAYREIEINNTYKNPVACSMFLQYFSTHRCSNIEAAYVLYENEKSHGYIYAPLETMAYFYNSKAPQHASASETISNHQEKAVIMIQQMTIEAKKMYNNALEYMK